MTLEQLMKKSSRLVLGLMSGTSADGVDAALVRIEGYGTGTKAQLVAFAGIPFDTAVRQAILCAMEGDAGGSRDICLLDALLAQLYWEACEQVCQTAGIAPNQIDLIGSHGQTVWHQPSPQAYMGRKVRGTLQIGGPALLCEKTGAIAVSNFRVRDMAAGGQGAPLVPYTEYLLYREEGQNIALQNIGGIGNITFLPAGAGPQGTIAFDTGPGNLLIDAATSRLTGGKQRFDEGGALAGQHTVNEALLACLLADAYLAQSPPKSTGREYYGKAFLERVYEKAAKLEASEGEVLRTLTAYTAATIAQAVGRFLPATPQKMLVNGGGSHNKTLLAHLRAALPQTQVITGEEAGQNSDAKEAVAFAVLANEAVHAQPGNLPSVTGAAHPVVLGTISY